MSKLANGAIYCIKALYIVTITIILAVILFSCSDYFGAKHFRLPNVALLIAGIICIAGMIWTGKYVSRYLSGSIGIRTATIILFFVQVYVAVNILFTTRTWDAWIVYHNAHLIVAGDKKGLSQLYFSFHPNNLGLLCFETIVLTINRWFGIIRQEREILAIVIFQCILVSSAGRMLYGIILKLTGHSFWAWAGWTFYVILVGLSGWNVVPYSDLIGLFFATVVLCIYISERKWPVYLKWPSIFALSYLGALIKPTVWIVLIAIVITEIISIEKFSKSILRKAFKTSVFIVAVVLLYRFCYDQTVENIGIEVDPTRNVGMLHFVMMGLNDETDGVWYGPDTHLSQALVDREQRVSAQKALIRGRLHNYGFKGLMKHLKKKTLVIFNDGTFAWGNEGGFYDQVYENINQGSAPFLKELYFNSGRYFPVASTVVHACWLVVLLFSSGLVWARFDKKRCTVMLSALGIIIFCLIFEARARYLLVYVPFFIIAAFDTCCRIMERVERLKRPGYNKIMRIGCWLFRKRC